MSQSRIAHKDDPGLGDLRARLFRWALDNADTLRHAKPVMPQGFDNRRADNWRVQLAIAELAGDDWAERARGRLPIWTGNRMPARSARACSPTSSAFATKTAATASPL